MFSQYAHSVMSCMNCILIIQYFLFQNLTKSWVFCITGYYWRLQYGGHSPI